LISGQGARDAVILPMREAGCLEEEGTNPILEL